MSALKQTLEAVYQSLQNDNDNLDAHIAALKNAMTAERAASIEIDPTRIPQPNRQGRKMLQSYFKQRGVVVTFANK